MNRRQPVLAAASAVEKQRQESPFWPEENLSKEDVGGEGAVELRL